MKSTSKNKNELIKELNDLRNENIRLKNKFEDEKKEWTTSKEFSGVKKVKNPESFLESRTHEKKEIELNNIKKLFEDYIKMYAGRDDMLTQHFSEDFSGFTGGGDFLVKDKKEWVDITRQDFAQVKDPIRIEMKDLAVQSLTDDIAVTTGFFVIHLPIKDHVLSRETARLVLIFRKENDGWKITHSSISIPYSLVREGEVYPMQELLERNQLLEELISERTNQVTIANNNLKQINEELAKEITLHKQVEKELRESEQKYHLLVDSANEAIVVIQDGKFRLTNPKAREMTGYLAEEIESMQFENFVHPEDRTRLIENHNNRLKGKDVPNHYIFRIQHKDLSTRWVYMNAVLIDWEGNPATLNFLTDISNQRQTEEALLQSSQKWEGIISASPDGIGIISIDGKIKHISDKLIRMHGYTSENMNDILGKSIFEFIDSSCHASLIENTKNLLSGENSNGLTEYVAIKQDNSRFYIDVNACVLNDLTGQPESILYVERDITQRKLADDALRQSNQKLEAIISATPDGIGMISLDGKLLLMSDRLAEMYGYSAKQKDELLGKSAFDFIDSSSHKSLIENINKLLAGHSENKLTEYIAIKNDQTRFYIDVRSTILNDLSGNPSSILFVERDISDRKQSELIIQQQFNQLQELNSSKDKFFSIIAHDLRSPFQSLLGSSELLATELENLSHEEIVLFSTGLNSSLKNLYGLLENLLQWSMVQRGLIEFKPGKINLYNLTDKIVELSNQNAKKKKITIINTVSDKIFAKADGNMLRSVFQNLTNNSIKFTSIGGKITISATENNEFIEVSVQDTGVGMNTEKSSLLFNQSIHNTTEGTSGEKGTGLGLSLCKEFVERNGGKIWVESEVGKGSKFTFTLPKEIS